MKSNVILIGFMGVGKGTVAREIVKQSNLYNIDTDDLIETIENRKIKTIFAQEGEPYFRKLEQRTAEWLQKHVSGTVISTGGGFYKVNNLKKIGKVVYLKSSFEGILARIETHPNAEKKIAKRPLLKDKKEAKKLFNQRKKEYEKIADIVIDVENRALDAIVEEFLQKTQAL